MFFFLNIALDNHYRLTDIINKIIGLSPEWYIDIQSKRMCTHSEYLGRGGGVEPEEIVISARLHPPTDNIWRNH